MQTSNYSIWEMEAGDGSVVQGHLWLHSKCEARLSYIRQEAMCQKKKKIKTKQILTTTKIKTVTSPKG